MIRVLIYAILGYLLGSILFARIFGMMLAKKDITKGTTDENPGVANAFGQGGFACGMLTLVFDLLKGFLPVFCFLNGKPVFFYGIGAALVLAAPVIGHILPLYYKFQGGKGIAVSFGCLLGMFPDLYPVGILACCFLFYSLVLQISPHFYRTILTYLTSAVLMMLWFPGLSLVLGYLMIASAVLVRMLCSKEERGKCSIRFLGKY